MIFPHGNWQMGRKANRRWSREMEQECDALEFPCFVLGCMTYSPILKTHLVNKWMRAHVIHQSARAVSDEKYTEPMPTWISVSLLKLLRRSCHFKDDLSQTRWIFQIFFSIYKAAAPLWYVAKRMQHHIGYMRCGCSFRGKYESSGRASSRRAAVDAYKSKPRPRPTYYLGSDLIKTLI